MAFEASGNASVLRRGAEVVALMAQVQQAFGEAGEAGLLYPYDVRSFQSLYDLAQTSPGGDGGGNCRPVCVPFYVLHKMLAGPSSTSILGSSQRLSRTRTRHSAC